MEKLEIMVNEIYDNKMTYKEIDYITIMNLLKEAYLKLTNQLPIIDIKDDLCESCMGDDIYEDGLCIDCYDIREEETHHYYVSEDEEEDIV